MLTDINNIVTFTWTPSTTGTETINFTSLSSDYDNQNINIEVPSTIPLTFTVLTNPNAPPLIPPPTVIVSFTASVPNGLTVMSGTAVNCTVTFNNTVLQAPYIAPPGPYDLISNETKSGKSVTFTWTPYTVENWLNFTFGVLGATGPLYATLKSLLGVLRVRTFLTVNVLVAQSGTLPTLA